VTPVCKHDWRLKVNLFLDIPLSLESRLNKRALKSARVRVEGAGWPSALLYCAMCGRMEVPESTQRTAANLIAKHNGDVEAAIETLRATATASAPQPATSPDPSRG
jgi:hypothetical protein